MQKFFLTLLLINLSACSNPEKTKTKQISQENNIFDARELKAGDSVAGFQIENLQVLPSTDSNYPAKIKFKGEITLSGKYKHYRNDQYLADNICFYSDEKSENKLPRLIHDKRYSWFCFTNQEEAKKQFGPPDSEGNLSVKITEYEINYAPTEVWNLAKFNGLAED